MNLKKCSKKLFLLAVAPSCLVFINGKESKATISKINIKTNTGIKSTHLYLPEGISKPVQTSGLGVSREAHKIKIANKKSGLGDKPTYKSSVSFNLIRPTLNKDISGSSIETKKTILSNVKLSKPVTIEVPERKVHKIKIANKTENNKNTLTKRFKSSKLINLEIPKKDKTLVNTIEKAEVSRPKTIVFPIKPARQAHKIKIANTDSKSKDKRFSASQFITLETPKKDNANITNVSIEKVDLKNTNIQEAQTREVNKIKIADKNLKPKTEKTETKETKKYKISRIFNLALPKRNKTENKIINTSATGETVTNVKPDAQSQYKNLLPELSQKLKDMLARAKNMHRSSAPLKASKPSALRYRGLEGAVRYEGEPDNVSGTHGKKLEDFNMGKIDQINKMHWYLQIEDADGNIQTIEALGRPKMVLSNGTTDVDLYVDPKTGNEVHYQHVGAANWISGELLGAEALRIGYPIHVTE